MTSNHRGVRLTRNNVVDWLICSYPAELPRTDEKILAERYYDEERFLRAAVRELRDRKATGETLTLMDILRDVGRPLGKAPHKVRRRKTPEGDDSTNVAETKI